MKMISHTNIRSWITNKISKVVLCLCLCLCLINLLLRFLCPIQSSHTILLLRFHNLLCLIHSLLLCLCLCHINLLLQCLCPICSCHTILLLLCLILSSPLCLTLQHHNLLILYLIPLYHDIGVLHSNHLTITGQFIIWAKWTCSALIVGHYIGYLRGWQTVRRSIPNLACAACREKSKSQSWTIHLPNLSTFCQAKTTSRKHSVIIFDLI